ncbi:MAG: HEAT repeat domain-containing protein [Phycisphaeraceae bacterium]|nr:HEAT repeat domain-containing protein [Phycisphaeraceae bacterium]
MLERFLFRQNWEADPEQLSARQCVRSDVGRLNGWFYMLTYLQTPTGTQFRQTQCDRLFEIADEVDKWSKREGLGFLFLDPDQGKDSLAYQYWPRFLKNLVEEKMWDSRHRNLAYDYLIRMEPITEPNRYVEAFMTLEPQRLDSSISFRALASVPQSRKPGVYRAMKEAIEGDISQLKNMTGRLSLESFRADLLHKLKGVLASDLENAEQLYREIVERRSDRSTVGWLQNLGSDHALIPMLAKSDRADLRRLALYAIESHPSAAHRALLEQLLKDSDTEVSTAAKAVKENLDDLANMQVETLKVR